MADETTDMDDTQLGEFFWGCELSKENPSVTFSIKEEDEDSDFMHHTLFVKHAVLGAQAVKDELNIVSVETQNFDKETIKQPFISLTRGEMSMCNLDVSFTDKSPVTFSLTDGTGPIYISAVQLVEFPEEENADHTMDEEGLTEEEEESPVRPKLKTNKRKGGATVGASKAKQRSKMEASADDDDDDEDDDSEEEEDDDDDDDEEMDDEEDEPSPEKKRGAKKKNAKVSGKAAAKKVEKPKKKAPAKKSKK